MSNTIGYLTSRSNFLQVSEEIPITKQRNPDKFDPPDVFEGMYYHTVLPLLVVFKFGTANKQELVTDLVTKAKQIEYLITSLPEPEPEEEQVTLVSVTSFHCWG